CVNPMVSAISWVLTASTPRSATSCNTTSTICCFRLSAFSLSRGATARATTSSRYSVCTYYLKRCSHFPQVKSPVAKKSYGCESVLSFRVTRFVRMYSLFSTPNARGPLSASDQLAEHNTPWPLFDHGTILRHVPHRTGSRICPAQILTQFRIPLTPAVDFYSEAFLPKVVEPR